MTQSDARPLGFPAARRDAIARRPVLWLNLVCLDAPLVAISWQWLFAESFRVHVRTADRVALFLSAWLIYLSDRWFDSLARSGGTARSLRERFCSEHRRSWIGWTLVLAMLDGIVVWRFVESATLRLGMALATVVSAYLIVNSAFSRLWKSIPIKEIAIGVLFAAGTLLAVLPSLPSPSRGVGGAAALFACLCSLNCMSIAVWERNLDRARGRHSIATRWPRMARPVVIAAVVCAVASIALPLCDPNLRLLAVCLGTSFALLGSLHRQSPPTLDDQTALADLALLTPCVAFLFEAAR
jgi:hypothetical protein